MLVECLIQRDGATPVTIDKYDYLFTCRADLGGACVCDVTNDAHVQQMFSTGLYRPYAGDKPSVSPDPKPLPKDEDPDEGQAEDETEEEDAAEEPEMTDAERDAHVLSLHEQGLSYGQIAELVDRSKSWVANRVKILKGGS